MARAYIMMAGLAMLWLFGIASGVLAVRIKPSEHNPLAQNIPCFSTGSACDWGCWFVAAFRILAANTLQLYFRRSAKNFRFNLAFYRPSACWRDRACMCGSKRLEIV